MDEFRTQIVNYPTL